MISDSEWERRYESLLAENRKLSEENDRLFTQASEAERKASLTDIVWLVTRGEYSDYRVLCVAPTRELAEEIRCRLQADDVEDRRLLADPDDALSLVSYSAVAHLDLSGRIGRTYSSDEPYDQESLKRVVP